MPAVAQRGYYKVGNPYTIDGVTYVPTEEFRHTETGVASWYGPGFHGKYTANGEVYDMASISAAHPTLPIPSYARVTNLANQKSIIVRVNDRGPYHGNRLIDVSNKAAELLEFKSNGVAKVRVEYVYQDRNEAQMMFLEKTQGGWRIARVDGSERVKTLVPYGTPVQ